MFRRVSLLLFAAVFALAIAPRAGWAQTQTEGLSANIPFEFQAGKTTLPAGEYTFRLTDDRMGVTLFPAKGSPIGLMVITRLGSGPGKGTDGDVVFDQVAGRNYLAEVWLPGEDGFLMLATKEQHSHKFVHLRRGAK